VPVKSLTFLYSQRLALLGGGSTLLLATKVSWRDLRRDFHIAAIKRSNRSGHWHPITCRRVNAHLPSWGTAIWACKVWEPSFPEMGWRKLSIQCTVHTFTRHPVLAEKVTGWIEGINICDASCQKFKVVWQWQLIHTGFSVHEMNNGYIIFESREGQNPL